MKILTFLFRLLERVLNGLSRRLRNFVWGMRLGSIGQDTNFARIVVIHSPEKVIIGARVGIGEFVHIWGGGGVSIGNDVNIAAHSMITSQTHDINARIYNKTHIMKPIIIEDNVWIGSGAIILPGVHVGTGAVIGAGSVVTKDVPAYTVVTGVPARQLRKLHGT